MAGAALLFRVPAAPVALSRPATDGKAAPLLRVAHPDERDRRLKQETELRDLRPLFLPTERNAALPEPRIEPGKTFLDSENLKLTFTDAEVEVTRDLPPVVRINGKAPATAEPGDALGTDVPGAALSGFGRRAESAGARPVVSRGGFVEVVAARTGERVLAEKLPPEAAPPGNRPWIPLGMLAVADAAGLVSPLVITEGSRVEEVDAHFKNYLTRDFKIGARLAPGIYRITVAP